MGVTRMLLRVPRRYHNHGRSCSILALSLLDGRRSFVTGLPGRLCEAGSELCARRGVWRVLRVFGEKIYIIYNRLRAVLATEARADAADDTKFGTDLEAHAAAYYETRVTVHDRDCVAYYVYCSVVSLNSYSPYI